MTRAQLLALFGLSPAQGVAYLRDKQPTLSWSYTEVYGAAHDQTFTVAKVMKLDLLKDLHHSLTEAMDKGLPFEEWRQKLRPTLVAKGWYDRTEVFNPETGEFKTITVGAHRLRTIYETNLRSAYAQGRYTHQQRSQTLTYWMYVSMLLPTTRDAHRAMHGRVYPRDHAFWDAHYPPNGYRCKCRVRAYSKTMLERKGITVQQEYEPFADPGFARRPGEGLDATWNRKILSAPDALKPLAKQEKQISDLYDTAFDSDPALHAVMQTIKPSMTVLAHGEEEAFYSPAREEVFFWSRPVALATLRHEAGHRLDHASGWISKSLQTPIVLEGSALKRRKKEIQKVLQAHEEDAQLQDLFYLSSRRAVGTIVTRSDDAAITQSLMAKEAFANFFQFYLLADPAKLDIIQTYFPRTYEAFLKQLKKRKEQP